MHLRFDPFNSNPARHLRQDLIILNGVTNRNQRADLANRIASTESVAQMRKGISLKEYMNQVSGYASLLR